MHETTIARQAQIYFATAGSSALLLGGLVAAIVALTLSSSLRSFPIPRLDGLALPGFLKADEQAPPAPNLSRDGRDRAVVAGFGVFSGSFAGARTDRRPGSAAEGRSAPDRSPIGPRGAGTAAALAAPTASAGFGQAASAAAVPEVETSFTPDDPPSSLPVEPPLTPDPPADPEARDPNPPAPDPVQPQPGSGEEPLARGEQGPDAPLNGAG